MQETTGFRRAHPVLSRESMQLEGHVEQLPQDAVDHVPGSLAASHTRLSRRGQKLSVRPLYGLHTLRSIHDLQCILPLRIAFPGAVL